MAKPVRPEPKFFLSPEEIAKGYNHYCNRYFQEDLQTKLYGEKSTSYLGSPDAALAIKKMLPDAKIVIMLRNPVDRAISNYFFSKENGFETRSLREVFIEQKKIDADISQVSVSPFLYLERGQYCNFLPYYFDVFNRASVKLLVQEEVTANPEYYFRDLFNWLGVESSHSAESMYVKINSVRKIDEIEQAVWENLKEYYRTWNVSLAKQYSLNLNKWND